MTRLVALLAPAALAAALTMPAAAAPITGSINFAGSDTYSTTTDTIHFINPQTVTSDTVGFNPCAACGVIAGPTAGVFDVSSAVPAPPVKALAYPNLLVATANGKTFSFDLEEITSILAEPNVSLAIEGTGLLHLTGADDTPGSFFFSTQGPEDIEVSFSATNVAAGTVNEPSSFGLLSVGLLAGGIIAVGTKAGRG